MAQTKGPTEPKPRRCSSRLKDERSNLHSVHERRIDKVRRANFAFAEEIVIERVSGLSEARYQQVKKRPQHQRKYNGSPGVHRPIPTFRNPH